ncbi:MAG: SDR family oxidoreductase [Pseudomonadota bacterium]
MRISGRKFLITGAGRGLGAALAHLMADAGVRLVLLARREDALQAIAASIRGRTGQSVDTAPCDLADGADCIAVGARVARDHPDLDGVIHNGAMWLPGAMETVSDDDIQACVSSAAIGAMILTRHLLPNLKKRPDADIHVVVSTSGLPHLPLNGASVAFRAAKSAQSGFVDGLRDELADTSVRVSAVYPGDFDDISPLDPDWGKQRSAKERLTNKEVGEAILFTLNLPMNAHVGVVFQERHIESQ